MGKFDELIPNKGFMTNPSKIMWAIIGIAFVLILIPIAGKLAGFANRMVINPATQKLGAAGGAVVPESISSLWAKAGG